MIVHDEKIQRQAQWRHLFISLALYGLVNATLIMIAAKDVSAEPLPKNFTQLWEKAASYMEHNHWIPGTIKVHEKTHNLKGKLEEETQYEFGFLETQNHKIRQKVLFAEKNGKDISRKVQSAMNDHITLDELSKYSPFNSKNRQQATYQLNGEHRAIDGHNCAGFNFTLNTEGQTVKGTAWLDEKTGLPTKIHSRITSVPIMEKGFKIISHTETDYFSITDDGRWLINRTQTQTDFEMPKYKFKGQETVLSVYKDHWQYVMPNKP